MCIATRKPRYSRGQCVYEHSVLPLTNHTGHIRHTSFSNLSSKSCFIANINFHKSRLLHLFTHRQHEVHNRPIDPRLCHSPRSGSPDRRRFLGRFSPGLHRARKHLQGVPRPDHLRSRCQSCSRGTRLGGWDTRLRVDRSWWHEVQGVPRPGYLRLR